MNSALHRVRVAPVLMAAMVALSIWVGVPPALADEGVEATQTAPLYLAGTPLEISCTFTVPPGRSLESLLWKPELPAGYTVLPASVTGDGFPEFDTQGAIIFWGDLSDSPIRFSYRVTVPEDAIGAHELRGSVDFALDGMFNPETVPIPAFTLSDSSATHAMQGYLAGERMEIECAFSYAQGRELESLLWTPELPAGWTLVGAAGNGDPLINSMWGDITFFGDLTANPVVFRYTVEISADTKGPAEIGGRVDYALNGMFNPLRIRALPDPLAVPEMHTLQIVSAYGEATPAVGIYTNFHGVALTNMSSDCVTLGSRTFACSGWTMTGNEPLAGFGTNCLLTLTNNAVLTWTWVAPLISPTGSADVTMDEDNDPLSWEQPAVSAITTSTPDGQPAGTLSWSLKTQAGHGNATVSGSGSTPTITYLPATNYYGYDSFAVQVKDGLGGSDWITVNVTVQPVNDPPVLSLIGDQWSDEFTPLSFTVTATDVDLPPQVLTYTLDAVSINRGMAIDPVSGVFTWEPAANQAGTEGTSFTVIVTVTDNGTSPDNQSDSETFTVTLLPVRATHSTIGYIPGQLLAIDCEFTYPAGRDLQSLLWRPELPDGWTLVSASGDGDPEVAAYDGALVLGSYALPNPVLFTYTVQVPLDATGTNAIGGLIEYQLDDMPNPGEVRAQPDPLIIPMRLLLLNLDVADKVYDGLTNATVVTYGPLTGVMVGHDVHLVTTNAWAFFDTPDVGANKSVTVGGFLLSGEHASWYAIDVHVVTAAVTQATLTVTADPQTKIYGDPNPPLTFQYDGFVNGEDASVLDTLPTAATTVTVASPVGVYTDAITVFGGIDGNYAFDYVPAKFEITPKTASATPTAAGKTYGAADPALAGTLAGFLAADSVTASYSRTAGEVAGGTYEISATLAPAGVLGNYAITYGTAAFTISTKAVAVTAAAQTKIYGGADPALTYAFEPALVAGDTFAGALSRVAGETVGQYAIEQGTLALSANYVLTYTGADFTITKATPIVTIWPVASNILLGQTIGAAVLSAGAANVPGAFTFDAPTTAPGLGTASHAMAFTPTDSDNYATVAGGVAVTVHVAPVLGPITDKIMDELTLLTFTATATDQDQPPQDLFYSLDVASLAAGMMLDTNTGLFAWTPSELQGPGVYTVTLTVTDSEAAGSVITPLVSESFEDLLLGSSIDGVHGWEGEGATVVNDPSSPTGYTGDLPLGGAHTQTLQVTEPLSLNTNGTGITTLDLMVRPEPLSEPPEVEGGTQSAFCFNQTGDLLVYHSTNTPTGYAQGWTVIALDDKVTSGDWVRLTLITDYITSDPPNPMFQLSINGTPVSSTLARQTADIDGDSGGTWFIGAAGSTVGGGSMQFNALSLKGACVLDDVVLKSEVPANDGGGGGASGGLSSSVTFTITVNEVNLVPVANADSGYSVAEGGTLNVPAPGVLTNDTDADFPTNTLSALLVTGPGNGSLTLNTDGSFSYTHDGSETTSDSFIYTAFDGLTNSAPATVSITVEAVNDAPTVTHALPDLVKQQDFEVFTIDLADVFADAENNVPFTFSVSLAGDAVLGAYISGSTLTVANFAGARGKATITVMAAESGTSPALSCSTSFDVLVAPVWNVTQNTVYATIQEAVDAANTNDEIHVASGIYPEQVLIQKDLILIGAGAGETIVQAPETRQSLPGATGSTPWTTDYLLAAYSDVAPISVKITGFTFDANQEQNDFGRFTGAYFNNVAGASIADAGLFDCAVTNFNTSDVSCTGVRVLGDSLLTISGNAIDYTINGIAAYGDLAAGADPVVNITGNTVSLAGPSTGYDEQAITLAYGATGAVTGNTIPNGGGIGVFISSSSDCLIASNTISDVEYVYGAGVYLYNAGNCTVLSNAISSVGNGISLDNADNCTVAQNALEDVAIDYEGTDGSSMAWGIALDNGSTGNTITSNEVANSQLAIWYSNGSSGNTATHNLLEGNLIDVQVDTYGGGAAPSGLVFSENSFAAAFINHTANSILAETNWWGSAEGPTHDSNPVGNGVAITGPVDLSPWLGTGTEDPATGGDIGFQPILEPLSFIAPTCTLVTKAVLYNGELQSANDPVVVGGTYVVSNRVSGATAWSAGSSASAAGIYDILVAVTGDSNHSNQLFTFSSALNIVEANATQDCLIHFKSPSEGLCTISNTLVYPADSSVATLAWKPHLLYPGWTVHTVQGDGSPVTDGTNIVFNNLGAAARPLVFTCTFKVPPGTPITNLLDATVTFALEGVAGTLEMPAQPTLLLKRYHSADYQTWTSAFEDPIMIPDWKIDPDEAQRFNEYMRSGEAKYHGTVVTSDTPDGFDIGWTDDNSWYHSSDYQTWISGFDDPIMVPNLKFDVDEAQQLLNYVRDAEGAYHITNVTPDTPNGYGSGTE